MNYIYYGCFPIIFITLLLLPVYWYQVNSFSVPAPEEEKKAGEDVCGVESDETGNSNPTTPPSEVFEPVVVEPKKSVNIRRTRRSAAFLPPPPRRDVVLFEDEYAPQPKSKEPKDRNKDKNKNKGKASTSKDKNRFVSFDDDLDDISEDSVSVNVSRY
jgi:hypothetical protein